MFARNVKKLNVIKVNFIKIEKFFITLKFIESSSILN